MFNTALFFHQVHLIEVKGWEHIDFVAMLPVYTTATVFSMLGAGWAIDRWGTGWLIPLYLLPLAGGFIVFWISGSIIYALPGFILIAFASGISSVLSSAFWAEYYGTRHLGAIKSLASSLMVLGSAVGPGITGLLIDYGFDFPQQMVGIAVLTVGALLHTSAYRRFHGWPTKVTVKPCTRTRTPTCTCTRTRTCSCTCLNIFNI